MSRKYGNVIKNPKYQNAMYARRQMRDTIAGPDEVKKSGEMYLPIPSSWVDNGDAEIPSTQRSVNSRGPVMKLAPDYLPWWHENAMYRAYLMRARFPDMVSSTLRGMLGISVKAPNKIELPDSMKYLEQEVSVGGESLEELFGYCLSEVLTVGNIALVVDVDKNTDEFYITTYSAESFPDWKTKRVNGTHKLMNISFIEMEDYYNDDEDFTEKHYYYNENNEVCFKEISDDVVDSNDVGEEGEEGEKIPNNVLSYRGKNFYEIPVFCAGSVENIPDPQVIPLRGVSDIAISIYQINADLRQAQYLTCNPTLFIFGVGEKETPKVIGSGIVVGIKNPQGKAEYPQTDTSALDHVKSEKEQLMKEAAAYGANFVIGNTRESGEALGIKKAGQGANLVRVVKQVGKAIQSTLRFIARMKGIDPATIVYEPNVEFAEMYLTSQDLTALVDSWIRGAIDRETMLDNMRDAGIIKKDKTNEDIVNNIEVDPPSYVPEKEKIDEKDSNLEDENEEDEDVE